jgi:hypothetical protein
MKKSRRKARTGNPARNGRGERTENGGRSWASWLAREWRAFFELPEWLVIVIFLLVVGVPVVVWRWLAG